MATATPLHIEPLPCPFAILVDAQEQQPWEFLNLHADADQHHRPLSIATRWESLGVSMGDYTIEGCKGLIAIERKSVDDCIGTVLGWGSRRERFERELANLATMQFAAVVVEGSLATCLAACEQWGKKTREQNQKALFRSILAFQRRWPNVQWCFCDDRRLAEVTAFRHLEGWWERKTASVRKRRRERKQELKLFRGLF